MKNAVLMQPTRSFNQSASTWWIDTLFLLCILGTLYFILLGTRPLFVPDEGRYAEIAREMVAMGDYITPYLNGIKYFEKPVLFYWLEALAIKTMGLNLWSIRSVNAVLGIVGCLLTYFTARKLYNRTTGLLAALILGTSTLYFIMAHMISLDLTVTVFLATCLYAFILGCQKGAGLDGRYYFWAAAIAAALAVLTKGLIGIVFPAMIIASWIALTHEWRLLKNKALLSALLLFLLIATPWHILVGQRNPEFYYFYFIEQHFLRYTTLEVGHYQPFWFFIPNIIFGFFPWIVFLPQAILPLLPRFWKERPLFKTELFFFLWALLIFTFFSFSKSKLIPYILPVFPPLAILTARYLQTCMLNKPCLGIKIGYLCLVAISCLIACGLYLLTQFVPVPNPTMANYYLYSAATFLLVGSLVGARYAFYHLGRALITTFITLYAALLFIIAVVPYVDARSVLPFANYLKSVIKPEDEVVTFNQYYQDLPFYLQRRVSILNWRNELSYGMQFQDTQDWMLNDASFWKRWHSGQRLFVVMDSKRYETLPKVYPHETFYLLAKTINNALVSNHNPHD
jgi:4-amino-4-deoxy-L-arabinose transferase-like glycosyltransferase